MIRVGINGYGTIGKRVADAVASQPDMELVGVAKTRPNHEAVTAIRKGYALYGALPDRTERFEDHGIGLAGELADLIAESDVVVDATPAGIGAKNRAIYRRYNTPAVFQGGEDPKIAETSFNARANYTDATHAETVRVVSCNTTGLSRLLAPLREAYGVEKARITLIRRGGDPGQTGCGPVNDILPDPVAIPSHHARDVKTIFPALDIDTLAVQVPTTLMHLHGVNVTLDGTPSVEDVRELLDGESRLGFVPGEVGIDGTGRLREFARDSGRPRGDLPENCIWAESLTVQGPDLYLFQAIHQESNVVPENVDAIRAITGDDAATSMTTTDDILDIGLDEWGGGENRAKGSGQRLVSESSP